MSQKNALQTLRPAFKSTNLINLAPLKFLKAFNFLRYLNDFFAKNHEIRNDFGGFVNFFQKSTSENPF